jgi:hypothetical protein
MSGHQQWRAVAGLLPSFANLIADDFVFHFIKSPKDIQNCNEILKEIGLPKLHANIRLATLAG